MDRLDKLGDEVSTKIRSAIKAKLIELKAYVDDELPDYIMVMVANNRTKVHMEEDLRLFLKYNTTPFTNWLHAILERLKNVTLEEVNKKKLKMLHDKPGKKLTKGVREKSVKESRSEREKGKRRRRERNMRGSPGKLREVQEVATLPTVTQKRFQKYWDDFQEEEDKKVARPKKKVDDKSARARRKSPPRERRANMKEPEAWRPLCQGGSFILSSKHMTSY